MRRALSIWALLATVALATALISLSVGSAELGVVASWQALLDPGHPAHDIVAHLRAPRVANGCVVGALLALAGAALQVLLRNPLAEPYILGLSGGASLGALLALTLGLALWSVSACAALGAGLSLALLLLFARREFRLGAGEGGAERLLLSGVMLAALWGAAITLVLSLSREGRIAALIYWLMGDLSAAERAPLAWLVLAGVFVVLVSDARALNLLARGEDWAATLGVPVLALKLRIVVVASIAAGTAVALAGPIGFVGLVAPHVVRLAWGNDQRLLLPAAALLGAALVVAADLFGRVVLAPQQLPVGAVTAVLGAPLFLILLWRTRR